MRVATSNAGYVLDLDIKVNEVVKILKIIALLNEIACQNSVMSNTQNKFEMKYVRDKGRPKQISHSLISLLNSQWNGLPKDDEIGSHSLRDVVRIVNVTRRNGELADKGNSRFNVEASFVSIGIYGCFSMHHPDSKKGSHSPDSPELPIGRIVVVKNFDSEPVQRW